LFTLEWTVDTSSHPSVFISHYNGHEIKLVRPLSTVDNTRGYARVSHSRQWSNYDVISPTYLEIAALAESESVQALRVI